MNLSETRTAFLRRCRAFLFACFLVSPSVRPQGNQGTIEGLVVDQSGAALAGAKLTATNDATGIHFQATSDSNGLFTFPVLPVGTYTIKVEHPGFASLTQKNVTVSANETRDVGKLNLALGSTSEQISITAEATPIQTSSSEKSQTVDGNQLNNITLKGRDLFGYLKLVPGVIDTTAARDVTSPNAIAGITINGNTSARLFFPLAAADVIPKL